VSVTEDDSSLSRVLAESKAASQERLKRELGAFVREPRPARITVRLE